MMSLLIPVPRSNRLPMKQKILSFTCCMLFITVFCGGCGIFTQPSYTPVRSYDLIAPTSVVTGDYNVSVQPFTSESAAKFKMLTRAGVELLHDEFNRWSQTPAVLLTRYCRMAFASDAPVDSKKNLPSYDLSCSVLVFEADLKTRSAQLCIQYTITNQNNDRVLQSGVLRYAVPLKKDGTFSEAFADAMSIAAKRMVSDLAGIMKDLSTEKK